MNSHYTEGIESLNDVVSDTDDLLVDAGANDKNEDEDAKDDIWPWKLESLGQYTYHLVLNQPSQQLRQPMLMSMR